MKVSIIHAIRNNGYRSNNTFKQNFSNNAINFKKLDQNDVFVRLAAASLKDSRINDELTEMFGKTF